MPGEASDHCFFDSNIWLYAFVDQGEPRKQVTAKQLIRQTAPIVSTQIVNEVCYNLVRKAGFSEQRIGRMIRSFYARYVVIAIDKAVMIDAANLRSRYSLSFWDGLVIAAALNANCGILYSEDMQDGLLVEDRLLITNPFVLAES
jgi:predicted nucleic acid-binding protein